MVDPDATTLSFPEAPAPGAHAPVRHWIAGNIPGSGLKIGDFHAATTVSPFHGPSPPAGSHRYGQFIFVQYATTWQAIKLTEIGHNCVDRNKTPVLVVAGRRGRSTSLWAVASSLRPVQTLTI